MFDDDREESWPEEPEEFDPQEDIGPPVPEAPEVEIEVPSVDTDESEVPDDLFRAFWKLVAIFNVALFAASLGPMLAVFRGQWALGGGVFLLGVAFFAYGYAGYRAHRSNHNG